VLLLGGCPPCRMADFSQPSDLERALRDAAAKGEVLDLGACASRDVQSELLRDVLTGDSPTPPRAVKLRQARIVGALDLETDVLRCPLRLERCRLTAPITLSEATAPSIRLIGCTLTSLVADQLQTRWNLDLSRSHADGVVRMRGARIGGELRFDGAKLSNPTGRALDADDLRVEGSAFFRHGFEALGGVYLPRAHIGGRLVFDSATLTSRGATGRSSAGSGSALRGDRLRANEGMFCRQGFKAVGEIRLPRAHIGGQLSFKDATLNNPSGQALYAHGLRVDHSMRCERCTADGCDEEGAVFLLGAEIGGRVTFARSTLRNQRGPALEAKRLRVELDVCCNEGFVAEGEVLLPGAQIRGALRFDGATLKSGSQLALDLEAVHVTTLDLRFAEMPSGTVKLTDAAIGRLRDKPYPNPDRWPRCQLDGCRYDTLEATSEQEVTKHVKGQEVTKRVKERLAWVARDPDHYSPRPYEQLAAVYRAHGEDAAARRVAIEKQRRRRDVLDFPARAWSWFLEVTVGHGYRPWLAGGWLLSLMAIGGVLFGKVFEHGLSQDLTPAKRQVTSFEPVIYTADALVPVLNLGQETAWNAHGAALWTTAALTVVGWLLTTALLAGFAARRQ
jgi:hypothetical protein